MPGNRAEAPIHIPVLPEETLALLAPAAGGVYLDCNLGLGGHPARTFAPPGPPGIPVALDWDLSLVHRCPVRGEGRAQRILGGIPGEVAHVDSGTHLSVRSAEEVLGRPRDRSVHDAERKQASEKGKRAGLYGLREGGTNLAPLPPTIEAARTRAATSHARLEGVRSPRRTTSPRPERARAIRRRTAERSGLRRG